MNRAKLERGFTLLELLAATAITVILAAAMLTVTVGVLSVWRRSQDRFTTGSQAQLVLDYLERDLQSALCRPTGQTWLAVDGFDGSLAAHGWILAGAIKPAVLDCLPLVQGRLTIAGAKFGRSGAWLRFFTSDSPTTSDRTLPLAVGYQIVRRSSTGTVVDPSTIRYTLFRSVVDDDGVFDGGYSIPNYDARLRSPSLSDVIATNVIDFGVWLYARESNGSLRRIHPESPSDAVHAANSESTRPAVADVMIRILTEEGATMIAAIEQGIVGVPPGRTQGEWWWDTAQRHSHLYVRRIEIQARSQ